MPGQFIIGKPPGQRPQLLNAGESAGRSLSHSQRGGAVTQRSRQLAETVQGHGDVHRLLIYLLQPALPPLLHKQEQRYQ